MSGLARGFNTGFRLADMVAREDESQRRFGLQQERLDNQEAEGLRRFNVQQDRLDKQDARQQQQFEANMEQINYAKSRRPFQEQKENTLFDLQTQQSQAAIEQARLNLKDKKKTMQRADIIDAYGVANQEFEKTGTISPDTFEQLQAVAGGTAFDPLTFADQDYIQATDYLTQIAQFGFKDADIDKLMASFNTVYKPEINRLRLADGAAYNRVTDAKAYKDGALQFQVTAYDKDGHPMTSQWHHKVIPYGDLVDNTMARKSVLASVIANPRFHAQLNYLASQTPNKYGQGAQQMTMNNIKYLQTFYADSVDDLNKNKRAVYEQIGKSLMGEAEKKKAIEAAVTELEQGHYTQLLALISEADPSELASAHIPVSLIQARAQALGLLKGLGGGQGQTPPPPAGASFDDEIKAHLQQRGLTPAQ